MCLTSLQSAYGVSFSVSRRCEIKWNAFLGDVCPIAPYWK